MSTELKDELQLFLGLALDIREDDGNYVLTKDQLRVILNRYKKLNSILKKLLRERQRLEFSLVEDRLKKLGVTKVDDYMN